MALGQAAGAAASIAIDNKSIVQDVLYTDLENQLMQDGQVLHVRHP